MTPGLQALVLAIALLTDAGVHERHRASEPVVRAPGYAPLAFDAPPAGSYELPALGPAADGGVLDSEGREITLHDLYRDKLVVLSFIYTSCPDVNGCPLAGFVLSQLQKHVLADSFLREDVRLLSLSFDPGIDTPARMAAYGENLRRHGGDWQFLTSTSETELEPILESYDQFVQRDYDEAGNYLGSLSHILRVYLIDRAGRVRNIYSPSFLHADVLLADLRTLKLAEQETVTRAKP